MTTILPDQFNIPGYFQVLDGKIAPEIDSLSYGQAGESPRNPLIKCLSYRLSWKTPQALYVDIFTGDSYFPTVLFRRLESGIDYNFETGEIAYEGIIGYTDEENPENNDLSASFDFTRQDEFHAITDNGPPYNSGPFVPVRDDVPLGNIVEVHVRLRAHYTLGYQDIERKFFWQRKQENSILFGPALIPSIPPHPVLVNSLTVPIEFFPYWKNEEGAKKYGGWKTVEVLDEFEAPCQPFGHPHNCRYVHYITETNIEEINEIVLYPRLGLDGFPGEINQAPPGYPDFSNYFYFINFWFRAAKESSQAFCYNVVLFLGGNSAPKTSPGQDSFLGYDLNGDGALPPPSAASSLTLNPDLSHNPIANPPFNWRNQLCFSGGTYINTQANEIILNMYDHHTGGNIIYTMSDYWPYFDYVKFCRGQIKNVDGSKPLGDKTLSFWLEVEERGPNRKSNLVFCSILIVLTVPLRINNSFYNDETPLENGYYFSAKAATHPPDYWPYGESFYAGEIYKCYFYEYNKGILDPVASGNGIFVAAGALGAEEHVLVPDSSHVILDNDGYNDLFSSGGHGWIELIQTNGDRKSNFFEFYP